MPTYRLVVADLDGTVRSRVLGITPGVRAAVAAAQALGVRVCVATGRMWAAAAPWLAALGADPPAILYNGGQVFDFASSRVLYDRRLPRDVARRALALLQAEPEARIHLFLADRVYAERPDPLTEAYAADDGVTVDFVPALAPLLDADPHKLLVIGPPARMQALGDSIRAPPFALKPILALTSAEDFRAKGLAEKKAIFETIAELGPAAAIPLFREMLLKKGWFKAADKESVLCAVAGLMKMRSPAALDLLEEARSQRNIEIRGIIEQAISSLGAGPRHAAAGFGGGLDGAA